MNSKKFRAISVPINAKLNKLNFIEISQTEDGKYSGKYVYNVQGIF